MREYELAERVLAALHRQYDSGLKNDKDRLRDFSLVLERLADIEYRQGKATAAFNRFVASLEVRREILSEFGRSPQALRDLSISLNKVADMMRAVGTSSITDEGESKTALDLYVASLEVRREILSEFGRSPQALRDLSVSLERVADMMVRLGRLRSRTKGRAKRRWICTSPAWRFVERS